MSETNRRVAPLRGPLSVVFTMECQPVQGRTSPLGPRRWEESARAIDGFCTRLANAGFRPTLFLAPQCAAEHAPLMEDLGQRGAELGLFVQPQSLPGGAFRRHLGQYGREEQRTAIQLALTLYQDALRRRAQSVRPALFSASDDTFPVCYELGFRQGSVSSPGRQETGQAAVWTGAPPDPHYVDPQSRLRPGDLPFLEVPLTTDPTQVRGGRSPELAIEQGTLDAWHRPLIEAQLQRMAADAVPFPMLCFTTSSACAYGSAGDQADGTLQALIAYLVGLRDRYDIMPVTLLGAHARFRGLADPPGGAG